MWSRALPRATLGWLRLALALMVVDLHYGFFRNDIQPHLTAWLGPLDFINDGDIAVFGFFSLSGYLVADMIVRGRYPVRDAGELLRFTLNRWLRIYPLYSLAFAAWVFVAPPPIPKGWNLAGNLLLWPFGLWSFFYDQARFGPLFQHVWLEPAWTLTLDLVFYPIGAVLSLARRRWLWAWLGLAGAGWLTAMCLAPDGNWLIGYEWWHFRYWTGAGSSVLAFTLGIALRREADRLPRPDWSAWLAVVVVLWCAYLPLGLGYFSSSLFATLALAWLVHVLAGAGRGRYETALGNYTYALYLLHIPVIFWMFAHVSKQVAPWTALAVSLPGAYLVAQFVERPLERWRRRWFRPAVAEDKVVARVVWSKTAAALTLFMALSTLYYIASALFWAGDV